MKKFNFTIDGDKFAVRVRKIENSIANIEVNGTPYKVHLEKEVKTTKTPVVLVRKDIDTKQVDERSKHNLDAISQSKPVVQTIKSPLPGKILKVNVAVGDKVKEGDVLLVMESMKMENNVLADKSGTILKVNAPIGETVLQDEVLFEIE